MRRIMCSRSIGVLLFSALVVFSGIVSTSTGQTNSNHSSKLADIAAQRETVRLEIEKQIRRAEDSDRVHELQKGLAKANGDLCDAAERTVEVKKLEEQRAAVEAKLSELRKERTQIARSSPKLVEASSQIEKAEKLVRDESQAKNKDVDVAAVRLARDNAKEQYEKMQDSIPEIRKITEKIAVLMDERRRLGSKIKTTVETNAELSRMNSRRLQIEAELQAARNTETPELNSLRARETELRREYARLLAAEKSQAGCSKP